MMDTMLEAGGHLPLWRRVRAFDVSVACKMCSEPAHWNGVGRHDPWCKTCAANTLAPGVAPETSPADVAFGELLEAVKDRSPKRVRDLYVSVGFFAWSVTALWADERWRIEDYTADAYYVAPCQVSYCSNEDLVRVVLAAIEAHMPPGKEGAR